jgi:50S ribosomal protein L16 3-hydroxylase
MELRPGLQKLLHPATETEFFDDFRSGRPFVLHGSPDRLPELALHPTLQSPASVMATCRGTSVTAMMLDRKDESNSVQVTPEVALKLYESGMNLSVSNAEQFIPSLLPWVQNLKWDLGMPKTTWGRCIVYLSPPNSGAPAHFDVNLNFSLQLSGRKTWTLAPNDSVTFPTERFVMGIGEPSEALRAQARGPFPKKLPDDAQVVELRPGSLLCVPRGYWHTTTSTQETMSINFTFSQPSWAMLFARALVSRLHRHEAWRKTPIARGDDPSDVALLREARALSDVLRKALEDIDPQDVVRAASPFSKVYRRAGGVTLRQSSGAIAFDIPGRGWMPLEASDEYLPVLKFMFEDADWFRSSDAFGVQPGDISHPDIVLLLHRLVEAKLLESRDE